jgi:hypothetical protein
VANRAISETVFASANSQVQSAVYSRYSSPLTPGSVLRAIPTQRRGLRPRKHLEYIAEGLKCPLELPGMVKIMHSRRNSGDNEGRPESGSSDDPVCP